MDSVTRCKEIKKDCDKKERIEKIVIGKRLKKIVIKKTVKRLKKIVIKKRLKKIVIKKTVKRPHVSNKMNSVVM